MHIHEYQAKQLFSKYGIPIPKGVLITTPDEVQTITNFLPEPIWVVKAQIHAGGRGKSGGIKIAKSVTEAKKIATQFLGMTLVTPQTGPNGKKIHKVWIEEGINIIQELYIAVTFDRETECLAIITSPVGGTNIEEVAEKTPEKIFTIHIQQNYFLWPFQTRNLLFSCGLQSQQIKQWVNIIQSLLFLVLKKGATLAEINPLAVTSNKDLIALDGKIIFDDSSLKKYPEIAALNDPNENDKLERQAAKLGLNYIRLNGNVGTMVNGAGLAMATMDIIKQAGAEPANFLDIGGGANEEMITKGFEVIISDPNVKIIFINIFGGILRCDTLATGVVTAAKKINLDLPLVIRLEGTNVIEGKKILSISGLNFEIANSISEAAAQIIKLLKGTQ